jgi:predicted phosphodiesterase
MKIIAISDTHTKHLEIPKEYLENLDGSISTIIHAGDISSRGDKDEIINFMEWYSKLPFDNKILIAGNHDFFFEQAKKEDIDDMLAKYPNIIYLNDSGIEIDGVKFWGSPVQPWFYNWAFNRIGDSICKHWDLIPLDINVLITHGPIKGYLDSTIRGESTGCPYLLQQITKMKELRLHVAGHIHEAYGIYEFADGVTFINASVLDHKYKMKNNPILIEI